MFGQPTVYLEAKGARSRQGRHLRSEELDELALARLCGHLDGLLDDIVAILVC